MRTFGIIVFVAAAVGAGLFFGGFVGGDVDVELTTKGRTTYNQGVDQAQQSLDHLKLQDGK